MTNEEKANIKGIISEYVSCYSDIEKLEREIELLLDRKNELVDRLQGIRNSEMEAISELKEKYGEDAALDLEKMKIVNGKD